MKTAEGLISLTPGAIDRVKAFAQAEEGSEGKALRIYVQGGGCSGFEYGFAFDELQDGDTEVEDGEVRVVVDTFSAPYLKGSVVDYVEDFRGSGFVVRNPNAKGTCGCGESFSV